MMSLIADFYRAKIREAASLLNALEKVEAQRDYLAVACEKYICFCPKKIQNCEKTGECRDCWLEMAAREMKL
jgi:hypothetical protein